MNLNNIYSKPILNKEPIPETEDQFNLPYLLNKEKLSIIADYFIKLTIEETVGLVNLVKQDRSCVQVAAIFLSLLTFDCDMYYLDENEQNICHFISCKCEVKNLLILFDFLRFHLKVEALEAN